MGIDAGSEWYKSQSGRRIENVITELNERITKVEESLCILRSDPERLEKFPALMKAYEEYKIIERLVYGEE
jgi:hypothetical protein